MSTRQDETVEFWSKFDHGDLAARTAHLHAQRRELLDKIPAERVEGARAAIAALFARGRGIEVGGGPRPFPVPPSAQLISGDIRGEYELRKYFSADSEIPMAQIIDAQTFAGIVDKSQDFAISAHVIEHLPDPIGAIENAVRVLKDGGHFILVVPDMRFTFDQHRPPTRLDHSMRDWLDRGVSTKLEAYVEAVKYVSISFNGEPTLSDAEIAQKAKNMMLANADIHFHAWTFDGFLELLEAIKGKIGFEIVARVEAMVNENIFVLRKGAT